MHPNLIQTIQFEGYTPVQITNLKITKNRIRKIIAKYIPINDDGVCPIWDDLESMQHDVQQVSSLLAYVSSLIGYIDGLANQTDDIKKLVMAKASTEAAEITDPNNVPPKKVTAKTKENLTRVAAEATIISNANLMAMAREYKNFQYETNEWVRTICFRIKILDGERTNERRFNN